MSLTAQKGHAPPDITTLHVLTNTLDMRRSNCSVQDYNWLQPDLFLYPWPLHLNLTWSQWRGPGIHPEGRPSKSYVGGWGRPWEAGVGGVCALVYYFGKRMQDYLSLTKLQHRFNPKFHLNILYTLDGLKWDSHSLKKRANVPVCLHNHGQVRGYTSYGCVTVHAPCTKTDVKYEKKEEEKPFINLIPLLICERPSSSAFPGPRRRQEDNLGRWYFSARPSRRRSYRHRRQLLQRHLAALCVPRERKSCCFFEPRDHFWVESNA